MTQAVLEIFAMLLGALLIGVFFTSRYWKPKYQTKEEEVEKLVSKVGKLASQVKNLSNSLENQKSDYEQQMHNLKSESEKEKNQLKKEVKKEKKEIKELTITNKELEHIIELKDEELEEKERELQAIDGQFKTHKISYYKQIDGKRYKAAILADADEAVAGKGDGRISKADAEKIFAHVSDGSQYTKVEKDTMHFIRENYKWTPEADAMFRTKVRSWAAKGHHLD